MELKTILLSNDYVNTCNRLKISRMEDGGTKNYIIKQWLC